MNTELKNKKTLDEIMEKNKWNLDDTPHIIVDTEKCSKCTKKPCIYLCPAGCYNLTEDNRVIFSYEGCLECGTCRIICPMQAIKWDYPEGGMGFQVRYG